MINFQVNISLVADPESKDKICGRNISLRDSIWDCSRFNPTIVSAMSERVHVGKPWMSFTA